MLLLLSSSSSWSSRVVRAVPVRTKQQRWTTHTHAHAHMHTHAQQKQNQKQNRRCKGQHTTTTRIHCSPTPTPTPEEKDKDNDYYEGFIKAPLDGSDLQERDNLTPSLKLMGQSAVVIAVLFLGFLISNDLI
ncbi:hypothetical protein PPROV_000406400 [Pycnococcus provasolii]|uniref:Uncharacterized protein n=1 Tax=Pycnococcus provasolii TaxID=41880 RepID=A0A830HF11_9CHLO|nr:hypothetical protein PPROV_000406400 [Pycnococcus provasolii]